MAHRRRRRGGGIEELLFIDLSGRELAARAPDDRSGAHEIAIVPAVEHWSTRQHDGRNVDRRRGHDLCGRRLVAPSGEDHGVYRVSMQDLDEPEIREVAIE